MHVAGATRTQNESFSLEAQLVVLQRGNRPLRYSIWGQLGLQVEGAEDWRRMREIPLLQRFLGEMGVGCTEESFPGKRVR